MKEFFSNLTRKQWIWLGVGAFVLLAIILAAAGVGQDKKETTKPTTTVTQEKEQTTTKTEEDASSQAEISEEQAQTAQAAEYVTVTRVVDGNTIEVNFTDGRVESVRYIGINTPETGQPYAAEATAYNSSLVAGKQVRMVKDVSDRDQYERLLRYVYIGDLMVNAELVAKGYANAATYPPDVAFSEQFVALEAQARNNNLGLWAPPPPQPTPTAQPAPSGGDVTVYITNTGEKYHSDGCQYLRQSKIPISLADAKARGYEP